MEETNATEDYERRVNGRRSADVNLIMSQQQLKEIISEAALAGSRAAIDEFIALLGRKTLRNIGIILASALAVSATWLTGIVRIHLGK